jgi:hypothetical protein
VQSDNIYALAVTESSGLEGYGGMVCVSPMNYNTTEDIGRFGHAPGRIVVSILELRGL